MSENENGNPRPDGFSVSVPLVGSPVGIGGTYYWNPGSPTAPSVTTAARTPLLRAKSALAWDAQKP